MEEYALHISERYEAFFSKILWHYSSPGIWSFLFVFHFLGLWIVCIWQLIGQFQHFQTVEFTRWKVCSMVLRARSWWGKDPELWLYSIIQRKSTGCLVILFQIGFYWDKIRYRRSKSGEHKSRRGQTDEGQTSGANSKFMKENRPLLWETRVGARVENFSDPGEGETCKFTPKTLPARKGINPQFSPSLLHHRTAHSFRFSIHHLWLLCSDFVSALVETPTRLRLRKPKSLSHCSLCSMCVIWGIFGCEAVNWRWISRPSYLSPKSPSSRKLGPAECEKPVLKSDSSSVCSALCFALVSDRVFVYCICSKSIEFSSFSASEISKVAEVQVWRGVYYDQNHKPIEGGLLDPRMVLFLHSHSLFYLVRASNPCLELTSQCDIIWWIQVWQF